MAQASPTRFLADSEPKTPMWLPALGATLFLVLGIWWATRTEDKPPPAPETTAATLDAAPEAGEAGVAGH